MLNVGYCFRIRSDRRLIQEMHLSLAYRWFCRLGLESDVPDHSSFSRHGRFPPLRSSRQRDRNDRNGDSVRRRAFQQP